MGNKKKYKRLIELSWKTLEYKLMYYHPDKVHSDWHQELTISDHYYDQLEKEYESLCKELGEEFPNHVGFPWNSYSGRLVYTKHKFPKGTPYDHAKWKKGIKAND